MFNLNEGLKKWGETLRQHAILNQVEIDELDDHLICIYKQNLENGLDEKEAFDAAVKRMGSPGEILSEYFKISFIDRLRRLPKSLVAVAGFFVLIGISGLPDMFRTWFSIFNADDGSLEVSLFGLFLFPILFIALGFKLVYLNSKSRFVAINSIRLIMVASGAMLFLQIALFSKLDKITPENTKLVIGGPFANFLYDHPSLIIALSLTITAGIICLLMLAHRVLTGDKVKSLFSINASNDLIGKSNESYRPGLIQQPIKTFSWLPY